MTRMVEFTSYEVGENGCLKGDSKSKKITTLIGKDMIISNRHTVALNFIQNAEIEDLEKIDVGLWITVIKD